MRKMQGDAETRRRLRRLYLTCDEKKAGDVRFVVVNACSENSSAIARCRTGWADGGDLAISVCDDVTDGAGGVVRGLHLEVRFSGEKLTTLFECNRMRPYGRNL